MATIARLCALVGVASAKNRLKMNEYIQRLIDRLILNRISRAEAKNKDPF